MVIGLSEAEEIKARRQPADSDGHLPAVPDGLAGTSAAHEDHYQLTVSNADGYLCHIHLEATYDYNSNVFRDLKRVASRRVLELDPAGRKVIEIEQIGESRVLWKSVEFSTLLNVEEDGRDPERLTSTFELLKSDILDKFNGRWAMSPRREGGRVVGSSMVLDQDLLPKGVPSFLKHVPVLGNVLRGISVRMVRRLIQDLDGVVEQLQSGRSWADVFGSGERARGHALELSDDDESEYEEAEEELGGQENGHMHTNGASAIAT